MKKTTIIKDLFLAFISIGALLVSFFALKEANVANKLNIEPYITIKYAERFNSDRLDFLVKNEGNVGIKNIEVSSASFFAKSSDSELKFISSRTNTIPLSLETNEERLFSVYVSDGVETVKEFNDGVLVEVNPPQLIKESKEGNTFIAEYNLDILWVQEKIGFFLEVKAKYRRIPDSKSFENISSYFFVIPTTSGFFVEDAQKLKFGFNKIIDKYKAHMNER